MLVLTLNWLELPVLVGAFGLEHLEKALALARILPLAVIVGALAGALTLAAVDAETQRPFTVSAVAVPIRAAPEMIRTAAVMASLAPDF
jgi:hypothetical protein